MKSIYSIILVFWELPQNILGLVFLLVEYIKGDIYAITFEKGRIFIQTKNLGISLGHCIFFSSGPKREIDSMALRIKKHEYGHGVQSIMFGPLYLLLIGIPSVSRVIFSIIYRKRTGLPWGRYFDGYPENWADKLGGVVKQMKL